MKAAVIDERGQILNVIVADAKGVTGDGYKIVPVPSGYSLDTRWRYVEDRFVSPTYYETKNPKTGAISGPYYPAQESDPIPSSVGELSVVQRNRIALDPILQKTTEVQLDGDTIVLAPSDLPDTADVVPVKA